MRRWKEVFRFVGIHGHNKGREGLTYQTFRSVVSGMYFSYRIFSVYTFLTTGFYNFFSYIRFRSLGGNFKIRHCRYLMKNSYVISGLRCIVGPLIVMVRLGLKYTLKENHIIRSLTRLIVSSWPCLHSIRNETLVVMVKIKHVIS
ncbi:hypothetical protein HanPI659440_Chr12g0474881 [Helianthus annuus]|nr:hypothetical protein HanPI659440_Chr12g0474881 [Helianthus annuus]